MRIIDTHLHLVYKDRFTYPWLDGAPAINRQWTAQAYFAEAERLGIDARVALDACVACEKECRKHADKHAECRACAQSCVTCIEQCRKAAAGCRTICC